MPAWIIKFFKGKEKYTTFDPSIPKAMKYVLYLSAVLLIVSCGAPSKEENAARTEKLGKLEATQSSVKKYSFLVAGKELVEAQVPYGAPLVISLKGLEGFKNTDGKVKCDASIEVFNAKGERIVLLDHLFDQEYADGILLEKFAANLELTLTCQRPLKINESQKVVFKLKDKAGLAMLTVTETFKMIPAQGLSYEEKGLRSDGFFIYRNSIPEAMTENTVTPGDTLYGYCTSVKGMTAENGVVRPDASIVLYTEKGETIAEFKDLYKDYEKEGADEKIVSELITLQFILPPTLLPKTNYYLVFTIGDKKSKNTLTARYDFVTR
jgi:hypothetical protein